MVQAHNNKEVFGLRDRGPHPIPRRRDRFVEAAVWTVAAIALDRAVFSLTPPLQANLLSDYLFSGDPVGFATSATNFMGEVVAATFTLAGLALARGIQSSRGG